MNLRDQIFDCLPAGTYALTSLLQLVDVVETTAIATAAVECRAEPRLLINPDFVAQHAATPERLTMLVLHELHHVLLGHTRRLPRATPEDNLVFDAVINSVICRMFPQPAYTDLLTGFYPADEFPACLLRPPPRWRPEGGWDLPAVFDSTDPHLRRAGQVYRALYSREGATYDEIRSVLPRALRGSGARTADVPLLGGHAGSGSDATQSSPEVARIVAGLVAQWPAPPNPIRGQSLGSLLQESGIDVRPDGGNRTLLRRLIGRIARAGASQAGPRRPLLREVDAETALPVSNRRSAVLRALGAPPLLHRHALQARRTGHGIEPLHVYVDVSGSVESIRGALYGAVLDCEGLVHPQVHLFSTEVHSLPWAAFRRGVCRTTHGTLLGCVTRHIQQHGIDRAVIITDGYVGGDRRDHKVLSATRLGVAYTCTHTKRDLGPYAAESCVLTI